MANLKLKCKDLIDKLRHRETGQSFVEIALMMPVLVILLVGAAEFASVLYVAIEVSSAARAAVAYGTIAPGDTAGIQNAAILDAGNITLTSSNVTVSTAGVCSSGTACTGPNSTCVAGTDCTAAGDHIETIVTVGTSYTFTPAIHLPFVPVSYTLRGHATQICLPQ
jgi:Flp pilus assembly protein TadG